MEAADRLVGGHAALRPTARGSSPLASTSAKPSPSGPSKCRRFSPKLALALQAGRRPPSRNAPSNSQRALGHGKDGGADLADAGPALADIREREIGHHRARRADLVGVIEVVDVGRVEIDGLLDPAQAELAGEECIVLARILRHRGDVVQALDLVEHVQAPSVRFGGASPLSMARYVVDPPAFKGVPSSAMDCSLLVNNRRSSFTVARMAQLASGRNFGSMSALLRRGARLAMARQTTERSFHHLRPVARRLPVGRRASGGARRRTPMRWPREGVLFRRHYAGAAPCSPARACLYTGLYQMNNRVCRNGTPLDARHGNIALAARALGYDPTLFGYTDVSPDPRYPGAGRSAAEELRGRAAGLHACASFCPSTRSPGCPGWRRAASIPRAGYPDIHRPAMARRQDVTNAPPVYSQRRDAGGLPRRRVHPLARRAGRRRAWFAHLSFISPHPPFIVPEPYNTLYDPADGPAFRRAGDWQAEAAAHPYLAYVHRPAEAVEFPARHEGQGARSRARTISAPSARSTTA